MTTPTLFDALSATAPHVRAPLVTPAALEALRPGAEAVPAAGVRCFYLETKLGASAPSVDLGLELNRAGIRALRGGPTDGPAAGPVDELAWDRVARYCRLASDPDGPAHASGGQPWPELGPFWLEFDALHGRVPGVYSDLFETRYGDPSRFPESERPAWYRRALSRVLHALALEASEATRDLVVACTRVLPPGAILASIGVMSQRPSPPLRLCFDRMRRSDVTAYLRSVEWPHDVGQVEAVLAALATGGASAPRPYTYFHLDVWGDIGPRIGVEFSFRRGPQFLGQLDEAGWLSRLVDLGLASPEACAALTAWPGVSVLSHAGRRWRPGLVSRRVNHLKVTFEHGRVEAKAYLCCDTDTATARPSSRAVTPSAPRQPIPLAS